MSPFNRPSKGILCPDGCGRIFASKFEIHRVEDHGDTKQEALVMRSWAVWPKPVVTNIKGKEEFFGPARIIEPGTLPATPGVLTLEDLKSMTKEQMAQKLGGTLE